MSGRLWWGITRVTDDFIRECIDFDAALYMCAPEDALPGHIVRVHVLPSDVDGYITLKVFGRENADRPSASIKP